MGFRNLIRVGNFIFRCDGAVSYFQEMWRTTVLACSLRLAIPAQLVGVFVFLIGSGSTYGALTNEIHFGAWQVNASVRWSLGIPDEEPVTVGAMLSLTSLPIDSTIDWPVESFAGLEYALNLTNIGTYVTADISFAPLAALPRLKRASFYGNFADATPLLSLTNLTALDLAVPALTNLAELSKHPRLTELILRESNITNAEAFIPLTNLLRLVLLDNPVQDVAPLLTLTNLAGLNFHGTPVTNAHLLSNMSGLTELGFDEIALRECNFLRPLSGLRRLFLSRCGITDFQPLAGLTNIEHLSIWGNQSSDSSFLANLTSLRFLTAHSMGFTNLDSIVHATHLQELDISRNQIQDASPLRFAGKLTHLFAFDNFFTNMSALTNCLDLRVLWLGHNFLLDPRSRQLGPDLMTLQNKILSRGGSVSIFPQAAWGQVRLGVEPAVDGLLLKIEATPAELPFILERSEDARNWWRSIDVHLPTTTLFIWRSSLGSPKVFFRAAPLFMNN